MFRGIRFSRAKPSLQQRSDASVDVGEKNPGIHPKNPPSLEAVRDLDPRLVYTVQSVQNATAQLITGTRRSDHWSQ